MLKKAILVVSLVCNIVSLVTTSVQFARVIRQYKADTYQPNDLDDQRVVNKKESPINKDSSFCSRNLHVLL